jgi:hypothetical protein
MIDTGDSALEGTETGSFSVDPEVTASTKGSHPRSEPDCPAQATQT